MIRKFFRLVFSPSANTRIGLPTKTFSERNEKKTFEKISLGINYWIINTTLNSALIRAEHLHKLFKEVFIQCIIWIYNFLMIFELIWRALCCSDIISPLYDILSWNNSIHWMAFFYSVNEKYSCFVTRKLQSFFSNE